MIFYIWSLCFAIHTDMNVDTKIFSYFNRLAVRERLDKLVTLDTIFETNKNPRIIATLGWRLRVMRNPFVLQARAASDGRVVLGLGHLQTALYLLLLGSGGACLALLGELVLSRCWGRLCQCPNLILLARLKWWFSFLCVYVLLAYLCHDLHNVFVVLTQRVRRWVTKDNKQTSQYWASVFISKRKPGDFLF